MDKIKKTLVLGASDNPSRYSHLAIHRLRTSGHPVVAIGKRKSMVADVPIVTDKPLYPDIHTITIYLNPVHQKEYYNYITSLSPRRIIVNPGAENDELTKLAEQHGIPLEEACTLVLLSTRQY